VEFREEADNIKGGPAEDRSMRDPCCCVFFILMMLVFIILGIFVMADQSSALGNAINHPNDTLTSNVLAVVFSKFPGLIAAMFILSIIIAVLYLIFMRFCLRCVIYTMVVAVFAIMLAILVIAIYSNNVGLIISMAVIIIVMVLFVVCCRNDI
jgi:hypothetical protein